jgi:hypothetical protein
MKETVDGYHVIEEFLLTKGEDIVSKKMEIPFKPLIDFGLICYSKKANATNRLAMKFDLEKFFMRNGCGLIKGWETTSVKVPQEIFDRVKLVNDQYRKTLNS